jgi:hypothetical protein
MVMLGGRRDQQGGGENGPYQKPEKAQSQPESPDPAVDLSADTGDDLPF